MLTIQRIHRKGALKNEKIKGTCLCWHIVIISLFRRFFLMRRFRLSLPVPKRVTDG